MSVNDFLLDFAVASVFIMIGQFLRAKVGFIQRFFIPASMLAGFMGLAFRYVFPGFLPMSDSIGSYPGMLIMVIFAAVGINGFTMNKGGSKGDVARMSSYLSYKMVAQVIQYGLVPAFSILVISNLWPAAGGRLLRWTRHRSRRGQQLCESWLSGRPGHRSDLCHCGDPRWCIRWNVFYQAGHQKGLDQVHQGLFLSLRRAEDWPDPSGEPPRAGQGNNLFCGPGSSGLALCHPAHCRRRRPPALAVFL